MRVYVSPSGSDRDPGTKARPLATMEKARDDLRAARAVGAEPHSVVADPLFADRPGPDFALEPDSPALKLGFKPIDMSRIGLRKAGP